MTKSDLLVTQKPVKLGPRIELLDIETAPLTSQHFRLFDENIGIGQILEEWCVLSYAAKELGAPKSAVKYQDTFDRNDRRDDSEVLVGLWELLNEADFIIAHNGKRFDLRKIRARMVMAGMPPFSPVRVIDPLTMARSVGAFTSNKLAWLSDKLSTTKKSEHKKFPGHALWREYLAGNPAARKEMKLYNVDDILSMEEVYLALRPYYERHPNLATYFADDTRRCPKCGSVDLVRDGFTYTQVSRYERFVCRACTGWCNGRRTTNTPTKRKSLLGN